ncbi:hypothetical protein [Streptomyces sp. NPDC001809]
MLAPVHQYLARVRRVVRDRHLGAFDERVRTTRWYRADDLDDPAARGGELERRVAEALSGTVTLTPQKGVSLCAAAGVSAALDADTACGRVANSSQNEGTPCLPIRATTSYGDIAARSL